ncbi:DUF6415 family natural product biosynthesis protein [Streptomyces sp. NPDC087851]|uniref:DUF6415 family natural product biosynthesis protein n=1 Tax=Streptomyces sp. NPDC087851 TaxID=3365810 RepID=UPI003806BB67
MAQWLLATVPSTAPVQEEWSEGRPGLLRLGVEFDAVKLMPDLTLAAAGSSDPIEVSRALTRTLGGPVICDHGLCYCALVPVGTAAVWTNEHAQALGTGTWITVPPLDHTQSTDGRLYWAVPPARPEQTCDPDTVATFVQAGHNRLEQNERHQLAHRALLEHMEGCPGCREGTDARAIAADCDDALAPSQSGASFTALTERADRLRSHLKVLIPLAEQGQEAGDIRATGALRDAANLLGDAPQGDRIRTWTQMRALARVTRILLHACRSQRRGQCLYAPCATGTTLRRAVRQAGR